MRRCAIYTRKSSEEGLEQEFNSLHAQREACEAYIKSQRHEGWTLIPAAYDDGGYSGGTLERPGLVQLMRDIERGLVDVVVVYKVDRLSRSLADFMRLVETFDKANVSFVSVTQQFNTSTSMGRLTLNVLLSFAQFEREVTGERIRDKIAASKRKGMWMGGVVPLGYVVRDKRLIIDPAGAETVRMLYHRYLELGSVRSLKHALDTEGIVGRAGKPYSRGALYALLRNPVYAGMVAHRQHRHAGQHEAIVELGTWERVQASLADHRHKKSARTAAKEPSLLAGLLFDDRGHPMSPAHATKHNRRYRYYVSQALIQFKEREAGSIVRVSAREVESSVAAGLCTLLTNANALLDALPDVSDIGAHVRKSLLGYGKAFAARWPSLTAQEQIGLLKAMLKRIVLSKGEMRLVLKRWGLLAVLSPDATQHQQLTSTDVDNVYEIRLPATVKRCGIETKLIVASTASSSAHQRSLRAMRKALATGLSWNAALLCGEVTSMRHLARRESATHRHVAAMLQIASLAPDIIQAIIKGRVPPTLTLQRLKEPFPLDWQEQRQTLGFVP